MGYFGGATTFVTGKYIGVGSDQFSYDYVACTGSEVKLSDCFYKQNVTCSSGEGIYIYCRPNYPEGKAHCLVLLSCYILKPESSPKFL